ncbi:MAG: hypothetical protein AAF911_11005 [Planctomycetota bacterium]
MKKLIKEDIETSLINEGISTEELEIIKIRLEMYKEFSQVVDNHHQRQIVLTRFFLTIQLAVYSAVVLLLKDGSSANLIPAALFSGIGTVFCFTWRRFELAMAMYSAAGHQVLEEFEQYLPARPHCMYWFEYLREGKDFATATNLREYMPTIFGLISCALFLFCLYQAFISPAQ